MFNYTISNLVTCGGFGDVSAVGGGVSVASTDCIVARLVMIVLFFVAAIIRKQVEDNFGIDFNLIGATGVGLIVYTLIITFTGSIGASFLLGIVGILVGGFGAGAFFGGVTED